MALTRKKDLPPATSNTDHSSSHTATTKAHVNTASTAALQWLTYAFWGWTVVAISYLVSLVTTHTLRNTFSSSSPETIPNAVAAVIILLIISVVSDVLYSRRETEPKTGFGMIVMVIHAVLFGLLTVGSLLSLVFSIIKLMVASGSSPIAAQIACVTAISFFLLFMLVFFRVVRPYATVKFRLIFRALLSVIGVGVAIWAIAGPIAETARTKDDRAVRANSLNLDSAIREYTEEEASLPASIDELATSSIAKSYIRDPAALKDLAKRNLIIYTPNIKKSTKTTLKLSSSTRTTETFYYKLCSVYKHDAAPSDINYGVSLSYRTSTSSPIQAGKHCENREARHIDRVSMRD